MISDFVGWIFIIGIFICLFFESDVKEPIYKGSTIKGYSAPNTYGFIFISTIVLILWLILFV